MDKKNVFQDLSFFNFMIDEWPNFQAGHQRIKYKAQNVLNNQSDQIIKKIYKEIAELVENAEQLIKESVPCHYTATVPTASMDDTECSLIVGQLLAKMNHFEDSEDPGVKQLGGTYAKIQQLSRKGENIIYGF